MLGFKRFLQTRVSFQKPLKSKLNRYESAMKSVEEVYKAIKGERINNLKFIVNPDFGGIKTGRIPSLSTLISKVKSCSNWDELREICAVLREIRFLGSPKRTEISTALFGKLAEIYEITEDKNDANLVELLRKLCEFDELNPLIVPNQVEEDLKDSLKIVMYTAKDILSK